MGTDVCGNGFFQNTYDLCEAVLNCPDRASCTSTLGAIDYAYAAAQRDIAQQQTIQCQGSNQFDSSYLHQVEHSAQELSREASALANSKLNDPTFDPSGWHETLHSTKDVLLKFHQQTWDQAAEMVGEASSSGLPDEYFGAALAVVGLGGLSMLSYGASLLPFLPSYTTEGQ